MDDSFAQGNLERAAGVIDWLCGHAGVREVVVCAGARNTPLLVAAARHPELESFRHFDERAAGFFALGRVKASGEPVAVLVTSGTAVAEILPAVIEAYYSGLPLIVIAGDRPEDWREGGAPQSIEQAEIFGKFAAAADLVAGCSDVDRLEELRRAWSPTAPAFINVCFADPVLGDVLEPKFAPVIRRDDADEFASEIAVRSFPRTGVVVGQLDEADRRDVASALAKLGLPVWAEVTSGLQVYPELQEFLLPDWAPLFSNPDFCPQHLLRVGGVPNGRFWRDLESLPEVAVTSVSRTGLRGLGRKKNVESLRMAAGDAMSLWSYQEHNYDREWADKVIVWAHEARGKVNAYLDKHPNSEVGVIAALMNVMGLGDVVYFGNSLAIREAQIAARGELAGAIHANRGANGIDGQVSTFIGAGWGASEAWGVFGDLTALYDFTGPWILDQEAEPVTTWRFVVLNNGGGQIFSSLPYLDGLSEKEHALLLNDSSNVDFAKWASMWNLEHLVIAEPSDCSKIQSLGKRAVIEIRPSPEASAEFWDDWGKLLNL